MTKYAPVAPIALLTDLHRQGVLGNYHLLLAHDILANEAVYAMLLDEVAAKYPDIHIIVDNSTIELGAPMSPQDVLEAAQIVQADAIVLPDVIMDFEATRRNIGVAMETFKDTPYKLMKVPQGKDFDEMVACVQWMHTLPGSYWGVGRWVANEFGTRRHILDLIIKQNPEAEIHLLGMSKFLDDDIQCAFCQGVVGIDSANPLVVGQRGLQLGTDTLEHLDRGTYFYEMVATAATISNIHYIEETLNI